MITSTLICLTTIMYFEARGDGDTAAERHEAMLAVGDVVMTRVERENERLLLRDPLDFKTPNVTPCEIAQAPNQFAWQDPIVAGQRGELVYDEWASAIDAASAMVFDGERLGIGATHFHSYADPYAVSWATEDRLIGKIGGHWFFDVE